MKRGRPRGAAGPRIGSKPASSGKYSKVYYASQKAQQEHAAAEQRLITLMLRRFATMPRVG